MSTVKPSRSAKELVAKLATWEALDDQALVAAGNAIRAEQTMDIETTSYGAQGFRFRLFALEQDSEMSHLAPALTDGEEGEIWQRYRSLASKLRVADAASKIRSEVGKRGGRGKVAMNPLASQKAAAKREALALWKEHRAGLHPRIHTVVHFATEVMRRWPVLSSQKVIERWSASWSKAVREGREPSC